MFIVQVVQVVHNVNLSILVLYSGIPNQVLCLCDAGLQVVQPPPLEGMVSRLHIMQPVWEVVVDLWLRV